MFVITDEKSGVLHFGKVFQWDKEKWTNFCWSKENREYFSNVQESNRRVEWNIAIVSSCMKSINLLEKLTIVDS